MIAILGGAAGVVYSSWRFPLWFITPRWHIDPWLYWGTGDAPRYAKEYFWNTYYFRRWTLVFPNYLFQHTFSPLNAQLALRTLHLFAVLSLASLLIWKLTRNWVASLFVLISLSSNEYIVRSVGTSYVQGTNLVLWTSLLLIFVMVSDQSRLKRPLLSLAGFVIALLAITYSWTLPMGLLLAFVYSLAHREARKRDWIAESSLRLILTGLGFFVGLVLDLCVGRAWGVPWQNLVSYSRSVAEGNSAQVSQVPYSKFLTDHFFEPRSWLLVFAVYGGILIATELRSIQRHPVRLTFSLALVSSGLVYAASPLVWKSLDLDIPQTNIFLPVGTCFILALLIGSLTFTPRVSDPHRMRTIARTIPPTLAVFTCQLWLGDLVTAGNFYWLLGITGLAFLVIRLMANNFSKITRRQHVTAFLVFCCAVLLSMNVTEHTESYWAKGQQNSFATKEEASKFLTDLSRSHRRLVEVAMRDSRRIWIVDVRPQAGWSTNISALYGQYSALTTESPPKTMSCDQLAWILAQSNSTIVVLGESSRRAAEITIRSTAQECQAVNLSYRLRDRISRSIWFDVSP